ncbi:hypothetical protein GCM10019016_029760 [Streptomyces prasinosporus]|uniref:DUF4232 domain-containing protein n=1 Tax=Streptomyces prasinosporus TaxID=68256 RepID=A0ABP6TMC1_9ACTN
MIAALLTSAACRPGASGSRERPGAASPAKPGGAASPEPDDTAGGTGGNGGSVAACTQEDLAVSSEKARGDSEENRHLLLVVQNAGDKACDLYHGPYVKIGDARGTTPLVEDGDPDPEVPALTLAPGEEAYAALLVSGGHMDEYEAHGVSLTLQGPEPGTVASGPIDVPLPVDTLYADDGQRVTHWTTASGGAPDFITSG